MRRFLLGCGGDICYLRIQSSGEKKNFRIAYPNTDTGVGDRLHSKSKIYLGQKSDKCPPPGIIAFSVQNECADHSGVKIIHL